MALFPLKVASDEVKKNYSEDEAQYGFVSTSSSSQAGKPKSRIQKAEDVVGTAVSTTEKTVFFPWRIVDDFIGLLFYPF